MLQGSDFMMPSLTSWLPYCVTNTSKQKFLILFPLQQFVSAYRDKKEKKKQKKHKIVSICINFTVNHKDKQLDGTWWIGISLNLSEDIKNVLFMK